MESVSNALILIHYVNNISFMFPHLTLSRFPECLHVFMGLAIDLLFLCLMLNFCSHAFPLALDYYSAD